MYWSVPEYDTSSRTNDEGDYCEKIERGGRNNTTRSVEYAGVGLRPTRAESSVAAVAVYVLGSVLLQEH